MNSIATTFIERQYDFYTALIQHLQLSLSALFIAIVIALPLGVLVARRKGIAEVLIQITGIMQTLPSLAVLNGPRHLCTLPDFTKHDHGHSGNRPVPSGGRRSARHESPGKTEKL